MRHANSLTIAADRSLYLGVLPATGWHAHAAPVLLVGLSGPFALHLGPDRMETCHSALVDQGQWHLFDPRGEQVALVYLEPDAPEALALRRLLRQEGGVVYEPVRRSPTCHVDQARLRRFDLAALLHGRLEEPAPLDPRVAHSLRLLRHGGEAPWRRDAAACSVGLSASRFNHLFAQEVGVSFRSYRLWAQVRRAMTGLGPRINLTEAALEGAFSDSSHFSRIFRQTFGMTPSSVLKPLRDVVVL